MDGVIMDGEFISNSQLNGIRINIKECNTIDELATQIKIRSWGTSEEPNPDYICYHMCDSYPGNTSRIIHSTTNVPSVYDIHLIRKVINSDAELTNDMKRLLHGIIESYKNRKEI